MVRAADLYSAVGGDATLETNLIVLAGGPDTGSEATLEQAASLFTAERNEAALAACEQAIALEPSFSAYKLRGQILQGLGRTDEARRAFEFALSLGGDPDEQAFVQALLRSTGSRFGGE